MNGLGGNCGCCEQYSDGSTTRTGDDGLAGGSSDDASDDGGVRGLSGGDDASDDASDDGGAGASDDGGAGLSGGAGTGTGLIESVGAGAEGPTITVVFGSSTVIVFVNDFLNFVCSLNTSTVILVVPTLFAVNKYCCV